MPLPCLECLKPCELHGMLRCPTCHTHEGECGYGGCEEPATHKLTHPMGVRFFCAEHATSPTTQYARVGFEVVALPRFCRSCSTEPVATPSPRYGAPEPGLCWPCSDQLRADTLLEPFCACGRVISQCDSSRKGCGKRK